MTFHPLVVLGLEHDFLFKSDATYCDEAKEVIYLTRNFKTCQSCFSEMFQNFFFAAISLL
jgi:hypothetical protein